MSQSIILTEAEQQLQHQRLEGVRNLLEVLFKYAWAGHVGIGLDLHGMRTNRGIITLDDLNEYPLDFDELETAPLGCFDLGAKLADINPRQLQGLKDKLLDALATLPEEIPCSSSPSGPACS